MKQLPDSVRSFSFDSYTQLLKFYDDAVQAGVPFPTVEEVVEVITDEDYPVEGTFIGTPSV